MKYKRLSPQELKQLKEDFIKFLSANTITADDWVKIKKEDNARAEKLIDIFSDIVYEKILKKVEYLEHVSPHKLSCFQCDKETMTLITLELSDESPLDLTQEETIQALATGLHSEKIKVLKSQKEYIKPREEEIFDLMNAGCYIVDDKYFNILSKQQ